MNNDTKKDAPVATPGTPLKKQSLSGFNDSKSAKKVNKKRNWAFVLYPESAPPDWVEKLQKTGLQCAISPLHDKDVNPTGEPKKAHYHVILAYSGPTSYNVVSDLTSSLNATIPQALEQVKGYYRYLTHKDNPEKYQYDERDIQSINGFSILDFADLTRSEIVKIKLALQGYIRESGILEYSDLMDALMDNNMFDYYDVASSNTYFFDKYLTSRRNKDIWLTDEKGEPTIDTEVSGS